MQDFDNRRAQNYLHVLEAYRGTHAETECGSKVPALMIAEQHGPDEAMIVIQNNHHERGLALENEMLEARTEYNAALAERGGS